LKKVEPGKVYIWQYKTCALFWFTKFDVFIVFTNHILSTSELITMTNIGQVLKSCRQVGSPLGGECDTDAHPRWNWDDTYYGTNDFGFSALPAGVREIPPIGLGYDFEDIGSVGNKTGNFS
jgi:hypothetical protein